MCVSRMITCTYIHLVPESCHHLLPVYPDSTLSPKKVRQEDHRMRSRRHRSSEETTRGVLS